MVGIKMRGELDYIELGNTFDFDDVVRALELESAKGNQFVAFSDGNDNRIAFRLTNLLTIKELD